jgi:hypothetical protein
MEHEITGHTKKVYRVWKNKDISPWKKVKEIGIEVLIIVFAVSLAAFLERQREHNHEQKEVKEFLLGLKSDLINDIKEMEDDTTAYRAAGVAHRYLSGLQPGQKVDKDSLKKYKIGIHSTTGLIANDGRYQGFKSSGKISTIENRALQDDILDLYQENIPMLLSTTNGYSQLRKLLATYSFEHVQRKPDGSDNFLDMLGSEYVHNVSVILSYTQEVLSRYRAVINKSKKIIAAIDKEYK